jgi:hypothetical protein
LAGSNRASPFHQLRSLFEYRVQIKSKPKLPWCGMLCQWVRRPRQNDRRRGALQASSCHLATGSETGVLGGWLEQGLTLTNVPRIHRGEHQTLRQLADTTDRVRHQAEPAEVHLYLLCGACASGSRYRPGRVHDLPCPPVDVTQAQGGDLGSPQPEAGEQDQHWVAATCAALSRRSCSSSAVAARAAWSPRCVAARAAAVSSRAASASAIWVRTVAGPGSRPGPRRRGPERRPGGSGCRGGPAGPGRRWRRRARGRGRRGGSGGRSRRC